jgi:flavodoxin
MEVGIMVNKTLLVVISIHHNNTGKIADVIANILDAQIKKPQEVKPDELQKYDLVGFGSGIYGAKHHASLLNLADNLPQVNNKKAFLFSTAGITSKKKTLDDHSQLNKRLKEKGYSITGDFQCKGFNTNSFLKYLGGMNKGRPNATDFKNAEAFARKLL